MFYTHTHWELKKGKIHLRKWNNQIPDLNRVLSNIDISYGFIFKNSRHSSVHQRRRKEDRENNNGTYQKILTYLTDYLITDDLGEQDLHAPSLLFIKNGNIYAFDDELSIIHGAIDIDKISEVRSMFVSSENS